jgi:predicted metal-dependent peptidase
MDEPFFAAVSRRIDKRASYAIPTAGVMINPDTAQFEMLYNPDFFEGLTELQRADVLKHEFYHVTFLHVTDRMPEGVSVRKWNIAADLAINSHLYNLPEGGCVPGEGPFIELPRGMSAEWYLANLPKVKKDKKEGEISDGDGEYSQSEGEGQDSETGAQDGEFEDGLPDTLDDHSGWGKCSQEVKDMAKERLKDIIRKAGEECSRNSNWGSVSASTRKKIMKVLDSKVDWRKVLRYFVKTSQKANRSSSIKRINRRYAYVHPGKKSNMFTPERSLTAWLRLQSLLTNRAPLMTGC